MTKNMNIEIRLRRVGPQPHSRSERARENLYEIICSLEDKGRITVSCSEKPLRLCASVISFVHFKW